MCGILGWVSPATAGRQRDFGAALDTLSHRGPDDRGVYAGDGVLLGHRRLSIIDLSSAGRQPMEDPETGNQIVFNGEIFNYLEIRDELAGRGHVFRTASDTEVLLHACREWGPAALGRLNGMWAFALWQPASRSLFIARDRFGVKPFYYALGSQGLVFASEPKAILALCPELRQPDDLALYRFLADGELYSHGRSFYAGIRVLAPGHCAEYRAGDRELAARRYWDYPPVLAAAAGGGEVAEFAALFEDAVRLRTRSDVKVGLTLSGGLDSTAVLAAMQRTLPGDTVCFTSVYGGGNRGEAGWAATAARPYGLTPQPVEAPQQGWLETLGEISWHMDGPGYSPAVYPLWHLMQEARRRGVYVLLEGQGADEALGGYPQYAALALLAQTGAARTPAGLAAALATLRTAAGTFGATTLIKWLLRETFPGLIAYNRRWSGAASTLSREFTESLGDSIRSESTMPPSRNANPVTARLHADHSHAVLPALLHYGDAISMAHGVESRLPFMDYRLVEWLFARGDAFKLSAGRTKWLLREYLQGVGQAQIAGRRDKLGYPTPVEQWLGADQGRALRELLLAPDARIRRCCDRGALERLVGRHVAGRPGSGNHLYRLVNTELWMRRCLAPT